MEVVVRGTGKMNGSVGGRLLLVAMVLGVDYMERR